jgi:hypothetical protein
MALSAGYPPSPLSVPPGLTAASPSYRGDATFAMMGLVVFGLIYLALTGWFAYTAYNLAIDVSASAGGNVFGSVLACAAAGFLANFLFKALVLSTPGSPDTSLHHTLGLQAPLKRGQAKQPLRCQ